LTYNFATTISGEEAWISLFTAFQAGSFFKLHTTAVYIVLELKEVVMARKFFSGVLIALGTIFLILSVVGIVAAWVYNEPLTREATSRLTDINTELSQAQVGLQSSQQELERALRIVDASEKALEQLTDQSTGAKSLLESIQGTLDDRLLPELKTARERLVAASNTLGTLRNTLDGLGSFIPIDLSMPDQMLADLIDSADSLDEEIGEIEMVAQQASIFLSDSSFILGGDLSETRRSLEEFLAVTQEYEKRVTDWRKQVAGLIEKTPKWIDQASTILTVFLLWFGISQFGLILHGLSIRRGHDPFDVLRRRPASVVERVREEEHDSSL
jgi:F0F1-type ATP synthase membrane subunit b/b'